MNHALLALLLAACTPPLAEVDTPPEPLPPAFEAEGRDGTARLSGELAGIGLDEAAVHGSVWIGGRYVDFELQGTDGYDWAVVTGTAKLPSLVPGMVYSLQPGDVVGVVSDAEGSDLALQPTEATLVVSEADADSLLLTVELVFGDEGAVVGEILVDPS